MDLYEKNKFNTKIDELINKLKKITTKKMVEDFDKTWKRIVREVNLETDLLLKQIYLEMRTNLFKKYPFNDNIKNQNLFDDLDLRNKILNDCKFQLPDVTEFMDKNSTSHKTSVYKNFSIGDMIFDIINWVMSTSNHIFNTQFRNENEKKESIENFLEDLRKKLKLWLKNTEIYFEEEVKKNFSDL